MQVTALNSTLPSFKWRAVLCFYSSSRPGYLSNTPGTSSSLVADNITLCTEYHLNKLCFYPKIYNENKWVALTLMSSRFRKFRYWLFLFHKIGGLLSPVMAQVKTALWPTVTVVMLTFWSSGRLSRYTSVQKKKRKDASVLDCAREDYSCFFLLSKEKHHFYIFWGNLIKAIKHES